MSVFRCLPVWCALTILGAACSPGSVGETPPATTTLIPYHTPTRTQTPTPISVDTSGTPDELLPTSTPFVHRVQEGETLLDITLEYGVTLDELLAANPGIDPRFLSIGQELRIPGTGGSDSESLLPTSTPLPLPIEDVICARQSSGALSCIATIINPMEVGIEGLSVRVRLIGADGSELESSLAYAPMNLLPAGSSMPLVATFDPSVPQPADAVASVFTAVQAREAEQRYLSVNVADTAAEPLEEGRRWRVRGQVNLAEEPDGPVRVSVVAIGLDGADRILGFTKWEPAEDGGPPWGFDVFVQSLRGPMERVDVLAEAAPRPE